MTTREKLIWFLSIMDKFDNQHEFPYFEEDGNKSNAGCETVKWWIAHYLDNEYSARDRVYVLNAINSIYKIHLCKDFPLPKL